MENQKQIKNSFKLILMHLLPGAAMSLVYIAILKTGLLAGAPKLNILSLAGCLTILPIELGYLLYATKKETGKLNIFKILGLKSKLNTKGYVLYALGLFLLAGVLVTILKPLTALVQNIMFGWIPDWYSFNEDMSQFSKSTLIITTSINFLFMTLIGPVTEEFYFRGFLMARMKWLGKWGVVFHVVLFAIYHFWTPWLIPVRIAVMLPLYFCVYKKDSLKLGIIVHCLVNFTDVIGLIMLILSY